MPGMVAKDPIVDLLCLPRLLTFEYKAGRWYTGSQPILYVIPRMDLNLTCRVRSIRIAVDRACETEGAYMKTSSIIDEPRTPLEAQIHLYSLACAQESKIISTWEALVRAVRENPDIHELAAQGF